MPAASPNTTSSQSSNHSSGSDQLSRTNLYIRGLNPNTTDKDLVNLCQPYGKIISTKAIIDEATNKCKGYGFVDFENPQAAEVAVQALQAQGIQAQMAKNFKTFSDGTSLQDAFQGKKIDSISRLIRQAGGIGPMLHPRVRRGQQEQDPTNLYIANLPIYFSEQNLENMFKDYGTVISTRILRKPDGISRGVGFARMESKDKCDQIITAFNAKILPGCTEPLLVKFADGGNKKKNPLQQKLSADTIQLAYDQAALAQNGLYMPYSMASPSGATALMTPAGLVPRYTMAQSPAPSYQVQSTHAGWAVHPQYIMQPQMAHYAALTSHGYTQIPYQAGTILQTMPVEHNHSGVETSSLM
ncbi:hypothetical protein ACJMK2_024272 [Sinanodonta woodiana]|uniref:RRM domain-containing protein n=1 Tax=Sinanodonta woodiana TaxID=1069815 RepID=A0ABD3T7R8_SINWO